MNHSYFTNLCIKKLNNELTQKESDELSSWIDLSSDNKTEYENIKRIWEGTKLELLNLEINIDDEWNKLNSSISAQSAIPKTKNIISRFIEKFSTPRLRPALAVGSLIMIIIFSLLYYINLQPELIQLTESTNNSETKRIILSDGSIVNLNSGSTIHYYEKFEEEQREIKLVGEAYFSVKKEDRPFIISTGNATTTVLGTEFNVWARDVETRVTVREGKVRLSDNSKIQNKVILTDGEMSKVIENNAPTLPQKVDPNYRIGWLKGKLIFDRTPLLEITDELERTYDIDISIVDIDSRQYILTGSFDNEAIDTVLSKICLALDLKYVQDGAGYTLTK